ncbi:HAMP domain-containing protein [Deinococcus sp. Arct2-2]|uniref:sensor histidine kinase n=1 Tax=Deinococcus sp. Arct2-2 TaxID=2568653 RepID=UPI0010A4DE43|nr:ATP-binding protein [Deinococcus sp. Arct2-2]THF70182.1 HAMP domain-containing protein [Deinococcus sp. Arct2-2]
MNRIWVGLWLAIMGVLVVFCVLFQLAKGLTSLFTDEAAVPAWGSLFGFMLATLLAAFIAWSLARPLSAVSKAAQRVAGGDLSARAQLPFMPQRRHLNWQSGETLRLLDDFNLMASSLERLETERQATTASIAHELRTPLAVLQARLVALQDGIFTLDLNEINILKQHTDFLARLVEDLRYLSLADAGKLNLNFETCDLAVVASDVVAGFRQRALLKGVHLDLSVQKAVLRGDSARLSQVIMNLLENALKFSPPAGQISVCVEAQGTVVKLLVHDSGPGIADATKARIFERFYHSDTHGSGSGLGLAIVKQLVELHRGTVEVMNAPEGGALFQVEFSRMVVPS